MYKDYNKDIFCSSYIASIGNYNLKTCDYPVI